MRLSFKKNFWGQHAFVQVEELNPQVLQYSDLFCLKKSVIWICAGQPEPSLEDSDADSSDSDIERRGVFEF